MNQKVFELLKAVQTTYPEMRVGQILVNAVPANKTLFYVTDEELCEYLKKFMMEKMYYNNLGNNP